MMKKRIWKKMICSLAMAASLQAYGRLVPAKLFVLNWDATSIPSSKDPKKHVVQKGETLYAISRKYKVSVADIQKWNDLDGSGIREGQTLLVSAPDSASGGQAQEAPLPQPIPQPAPVKEEEKPVTVAKTSTPTTVSPKVHVVQPGESLYSISKAESISVADIRKLNRLESTTLQVGQRLILSKAAAPVKPTPQGKPNPNQGTSLMAMIEDTVDNSDGTPSESTTAATELKVLTSPEYIKIPAGAVVTDYKDEQDGKYYKRVEERGQAGAIQDYSTDQTKFYAFHKFLPKGAYVRVDYPNRSQSILVEVINSLPKKSDQIILLTAKCRDYLRMDESGGEVILRYVVPTEK